MSRIWTLCAIGTLVTLISLSAPAAGPRDTLLVSATWLAQHLNDSRLGPLLIKPLVVDADFVQSHVKTPGFAVVDARAPEFYEGTQEGGPRDHRTVRNMVIRQ